MEPSWSLHLLSEILSAFSTEAPDDLRNVLHRVAESVDAEVAAVVCGGRLDCCIGLAEQEQQQLLLQFAAEPREVRIGSGLLHTTWPPLGENDRLVVGRLGEPFDLEERSLLRAMARSIQLSLRLLQAISDERQARLDASYQASHDPLTDLPNRTLVLEHLSRRIRCAGNGEGTTAVLFIDIDRFKWVNDAHGHAAGDELLVHVSRILRRSVGHDDMVGRLSGDEFIVITQAASVSALAALARRIIEAIRQPIEVGGIELSHTASVGISFAEPHDTPSSLIENADMAMYQAKALGRGGFALFAASMREQAQQRLALEEALRHAVACGEIEPHLQPIHALANGELVGFEALARWRHPKQGLLMPDTFIGAAEDSGLIESIDLAVLEAACGAMGRWQRLPGLGHLRISANVSARTLGAADLVERIQPILEASGILRAQLFLEITETSLVDDILSTASTIADLRQLGVRLAIDDFGTGYSSLLYLKRFPVGLLKIDRSFVANLGRDPEDEAISRAILSLARALGVEVVAEGVETDTQRNWLADLGCAYGQGHLFGRAQPIEVIERQLLQA
ncbi:EAL domain-containing protein [Cyanobium sp. FGCU-52]|nr:EAL domain-containing protein [Cyanobium sp. FGCU52]